MQKKTLLTAMLAAGFALSVQAEQFIDPIIVTATRTAQTVDDSLASVTLISREEIEALQPAQLSDLLQGRAGLHIVSSGAFGKNTSIFMRGSNSEHVVLLIDGVRVSSATTGSPAWEFLPISEIDRIEIVRGPRASIYGADAIGGVIQVFTRRGTEDTNRINAYTRIGSFNTREYGAGLRGSTAQTNWSFSANHHETDGINIQDNSGDDQPDAFRSNSLSWNLSHRMQQGMEVFTSALYSAGRSDFDANDFSNWPTITPYASAHYDFVHAAARLGLRGEINDHWFSEFTLAQSRDESDAYYENSFDNRFNTKRNLIDWRNEFSLGELTQLTVGIDWQQDKVESTVNFSQAERDNSAIYQVFQTQLENHRLQFSLRHDSNQAYGDNTTGQLAWGYAITPDLRSRFSWANAFKAPSFNQLYWPGSGNPDLQPEKSESIEAGLRYSAAKRHLDASVFQTYVDNLISGWPPENIARARMQGIELEAGLQHHDWRLAAVLNYLEHENRATGNYLARRPSESLRLDLDRKMHRWGFGGSLVAQGPSFEDAANTNKMAGYSLLNLRAHWQVAPDWIARATLNNLLDKDYQTAANYNQAGRAAYLSIHYQQ